MHHRTGTTLRLAAFLALLGVIATAAAAQPADRIQATVDAAYNRYKDLADGKKADHNPAVRKLDPSLFGIALVTVDGQVHTAGDTTARVSMASISKVFTTALVFQALGPEAVRERVGVDATGRRFNSIEAVERDEGLEMNPLVNAGAMAVADMIPGRDRQEVERNILETFSAFAGRPLVVLQDVYEADASTNMRNRAIAMLMHAYGRIAGDPLEACDIYTMHCAVGVGVKDLATMAATLAAGGANPLTGTRVMDADKVPPLLAVMATAGLYDDAGQWLFLTGLPAKSGVSGGMIAVSPGKFGIAAISPPLDAAGNSVRGQRAIADISNELGGNPFAPPSR